MKIIKDGVVCNVLDIAQFFLVVMLNLFQHLSIARVCKVETLKHPSDRPGGSSG